MSPAAESALYARAGTQDTGGHTGTGIVKERM